MKVIEQKKVTVELSKEEVNAIIYGLQKLQDEKYPHPNLEYWGLGGVRRFDTTKLKDLMLQFSNL